MVESDASDLVANDTNGQYDVFLHDRTNSTTVRVSQASVAPPRSTGCWTSAR